jgi:hypothetical protein
MTDTRMNVVPLPILYDHKTIPVESRAAMRAAVVQAITDLFIAHVPFEERSALFETARDLLPQCGWSPLEMIEAAEPGPSQDALFEALGLQDKSQSKAVKDV